MRNNTVALILLASTYAQAYDSGLLNRPVDFESSAPLISSGLYSRINSTVNKGDLSNGKKLAATKQTLCSGNTPRETLKYRVEYTPPKTTGRALDDAQLIKKSSIDQIRTYLKNKFFFVGSQRTLPHKVDLELDHGLTVNEALDVPYFDLIDMLIQGYAFKIPLKQIARLKGYKNVNVSIGNADSSIESWGYDFYTGKYMASLALQNRRIAWEDVLASQTEIVEAPGKNGSTIFDLKLSLDAFCKYAIPVTDLISD